MTKKIRLELDTVEEFIGATRDEDWRVRKAALKEMCPCHVKKEIVEPYSGDVRGRECHGEGSGGAFAV